MTNEIPEGCLPFDLSKALNGWPCVTRDGREVKGLFESKKEHDESYPLYGHVEDVDDCGYEIVTWTFDGISNEYGDLSENDIFLKKKTRTYYINVFRNNWSQDITTPQVVFKTEQEAKDASKKHPDGYLKTICCEIDIPEEKPNHNKKCIYCGSSKS